MTESTFAKLNTLIKDRAAKAGIIGLGYVGLPLAVASARAGFPTLGFDVDPGKPEQIHAGQSYIGAVSSEEMGALVKAKTLSATGFEEAPGRFRLITLRSNDQFNTTIYGFSDRMRGIEGRRDVLLINPAEMQRMELKQGQEITLASDAGDGRDREVGGP